MADLMQAYLNQQLNEVEQVNIPTEEELEQFRGYVKNYIDIDNDIKKLRAAIKDRNSVKKEISTYILSFMSKFNIEDLNTKYGKIRYHITQVKKPLNEKLIKDRLLENYSPSITPEDLSKKIFDNRQVSEKHTLKRVNAK
jgi:phosphotransferase system IIB component